MKPKLLTVEETAKRWGVIPRRVRQLIKDGRVEGVVETVKGYRIPENALNPAQKAGRPRK